MRACGGLVRRQSCRDDVIVGAEALPALRWTPTPPPTRLNNRELRRWGEKNVSLLHQRTGRKEARVCERGRSAPVFITRRQNQRREELQGLQML